MGGQDTSYRKRNLSLYLGGRFLSEAAAMIQSVAVGWTVYAHTHSPLALGIVGIVQFGPALFLTLPAGELCDRISVKPVLAAALAAQSACALLLFWLTVERPEQIWAFYAALLVSAAARTFSDPAGQAMLPLIVPIEQLPRAIASASMVWQVAVVAGPLLGGVAYALGPIVGYGLCAIAFLTSATCMASLAGRQAMQRSVATLKERGARIWQGLTFIWSRPVILGAVSLDLFAVLLGGATALLPIYAKDILHVGPTGLGFLRAAPAVGATLSAVAQAHAPIERKVGHTLFGAITAFGLATVIFAISTSFALSLAALFVMGASDMVSVNIRSALVQLATPDDMRGRVSAVNMLFIGASSELGAFESGITAAILGTVPAVALGGIGTLIVAALWMKIFPVLRRADRLTAESSS